MAQDKFRFDNGFRSIGTCVMHGDLDLKGNSLLNTTNAVTELVTTSTVDADVASAVTNAIYALQQQGVGEPVTYLPESIGSILGIEKASFSASVSNVDFGASVALAGNGTYMVATSPKLTTNSGGWGLYDLRTNSMTEIAWYAGSSWGQGNNSFYGWDCSMNHDATRIAISEPMQEESSGTNGRVYVYENNVNANTGDLTYVTHKIISSNTAYPTAEFGASVSMSGDGNTVVVGCVDSDGAFNNVQVFTWSGTNWVFEHQINSTRTASLFGTSVAVNYDGTVMIVGAPQETDGVRNNTGKVFIYEKQGDNTWLEVYTDLIATANAKSGAYVAISGDGNVAGMIAGGLSQGRVYRRLNNGNFGIETYLAENGMRSISIDYNGTSFAVGAPLDDTVAQDSGAVHTFWWNKTTENYEADNTIYNPDTNPFGKYGWDVAVSANGTRLGSSAVTQDISESILDAGKIWYHK